MYPHFIINPSSTTTRSATRAAFHLIAASFSTTTTSSTAPPKPKASTKPKTPKAATLALLKQNWLNSMSAYSGPQPDPDSEWVFGIDPDNHGALAVIRPDRSVEVFDSPIVTVNVSKTQRRRLDAKSIVELLRGFDAPIGTSVYIEQSSPQPYYSSQASWSMGFGYGMWIGTLVASGFSVFPVPSNIWKNEFQVSGDPSSKDASRELASLLFPSMSSLLKRKKDDGRAEALLIAAYGKGLKLMSRASSTAENKSL